mmetsp:Transcript_5392/g.13805  ORF Transcript_5392/g.13805 Transcript_5392/m.13805 type:complete len:231 (+) Transcript_5392:250-942(+)
MLVLLQLLQEGGPLALLLVQHLLLLLGQQDVVLRLLLAVLLLAHSRRLGLLGHRHRHVALVCLPPRLHVLCLALGLHGGLKHLAALALVGLNLYLPLPARLLELAAAVLVELSPVFQLTGARPGLLLVELPRVVLNLDAPPTPQGAALLLLPHVVLVLPAQLVHVLLPALVFALASLGISGQLVRGVELLHQRPLHGAAAGCLRPGFQAALTRYAADELVRPRRQRRAHA